jgi:DNA-binding response OmpR family regulator
VGTPRILIVEDDAFVALDLETIVLQESEAEVVTVASVSAAERAADGVDMAILDIDVVGGKTYDLARELHRRHTPFIFVSASRREELPGELRAAPFIAKPYDPAAIVREISRALGCRAEAAE